MGITDPCEEGSIRDGSSADGAGFHERRDWSSIRPLRTHSPSLLRAKSPAHSQEVSPSPSIAVKFACSVPVQLIL